MYDKLIPVIENAEYVLDPWKHEEKIMKPIL